MARVFFVFYEFLGSVSLYVGSLASKMKCSIFILVVASAKYENLECSFMKLNSILYVQNLKECMRQ